ncbi:MAG: ketopantoate reductase family protein [Deltaproteobacteria bacterium]|nr:ketopantoate reductase family protein [Deltaproteobacteria bacterium]
MRKLKTAAIIGAGAMGSFYAGRLYDSDACKVLICACGERRQRLMSRGLIINGRSYRLPIVDPGEDVEPADLIIAAVKYHDLDEAIKNMKGLVGPDTLILSVMNGIDSEERIGAVYGPGKALYGVAVGIDAVRAGNALTYTTPGKLFFGRDRNSPPDEAVLSVKQLFDSAGIVSDIPVDMIRILWWKFMINVGINQASAVLRAAYGAFRESCYARELMESAMGEVVEIADRRGIAITHEDIDEWFKFLARLSPGGKTSMLQDMEARRKTEVEMLAGKVIALGEDCGVATPVNKMFFNIIRFNEDEWTRRQASSGT